MDDADRFRVHAERCRKAAEACAHQADKNAWLKLASDWLLVPKLREGLPKLRSDRAERIPGYAKARAELLGGDYHSAASATLPSTINVASLGDESNAT